MSAKTRRASAVCRFLGFLLLNVVWLSPSTAHGQAAPRPPFGQGTHGLRALLKQMRLEPLTGKEEFQRQVLEDPQRILIVALGKGDFLSSEIPNGLERFLRGGGAVLVATDREFDGPLQSFGTLVTGDFVQSDTALRHAYRELIDCPIVEPIADAKIPIFDGLTQVATNRPSYLHLQDHGSLAPLARFPTACRVVQPEFPVEGLGILRFAAAGQIGKGRLLVLADHSVFINDMLLQPDNDNFDLTFRAISWLSDSKRDRVLFVEDGEIVTNFNVSLKEPPPPPLPSDGEVIQAINRMLAGLDRENFYNRQLLKQVSPARWPDNRPDLQTGQSRLLQWLTVALTVGLAIFGGLRLRRTRYRIDTKEPLLDTEWKSSASSVPSREKA